MKELSEREKECLSYAAHGYTEEQTALALHISKKTVSTYRETARMKLQATNIAHSVAKAIRGGYII